MTKDQVASYVMQKTGLTKAQVNSCLSSYDTLIRNHVMVDGERVPLAGLGTFKRVVKKGRPERAGINPKTGDPIQIPASQDKNVLKFLPDKELR